MITFPYGPNTPFAIEGGILIFDILRLMVVACSIVMAFAGVAAIIQSSTLSQKIRLASMIVMAGFLSSTELAHIGDNANWRLGLALFAVWLGTWGMVAFLRYETPGAGERMAERTRLKELKRAERKRRSDDYIDRELLS